MQSPLNPARSSYFQDLLAHRWLRTAVCHLLLSYLALLAWHLVLQWHVTLRKGLFGILSVRSFAATLLLYILFLTSQLPFLWAKWLTLQPSNSPAAGPSDFVAAIAWPLWTCLTGQKPEEATAKSAILRGRRISAAVGRFLSLLGCVTAGALAVTAATQLLMGEPQVAVWRALAGGGALGACYGLAQLLYHEWVLCWPIVQRRFLFRVKLGVPAAVTRAAGVMAAATPLFVLAAALLPPGATGGGPPSWKLLAREARALLRLQLASALTAFCWALGSYVAEVIFTQRHRFVPPLGSAEAESNPSGALLAALSYPGPHAPYVRHLAMLDLCSLATGNADAWRRVALFEETGATYRAVIGACCLHVDTLAARVEECVRGVQASPRDVTDEQMRPPGAARRARKLQPWDLPEVFQDYQLCVWSARAAASLTAASRTEDRYGVGQLTGSNALVVSSLLSALLALEALGDAICPGGLPAGSGGLHKSRSGAPAGFGVSTGWWLAGTALGVGPTLLKLPAGVPLKQCVVPREALALMDVLKNCVHCIVSPFGDDMLLARGGGKRRVAVQDWLPRGKPLFGTREAHVERLSLMLDYRD